MLTLNPADHEKYPLARVLSFMACVCLFVLTWYRLDAIGLDQIEILHVVASRTPWSYLLAWTSAVEVHPPTFYLLLKALYAFFETDFGVKSFLAAFSFGVLYFGYRLGRHHSQGAAMLMLALLAVNPILIQLSRSVRPHIMVLFFIAASLHYCLSWLKDGSRRDLMSLLVCNILGMSLHYMFAVYLLTQGALIVAVPGRAKLSRRAVAAVLLGAVSFTPVAYFYVLSMKAVQNMALSKLTYSQVAEQVVEAYKVVASSLAGGLVLLDGLAAWAGLVLLLVFVAAALARSRSWFTGAVVFVLLFPAAFLLATRHGFVFYKYIPQALLASNLLAAVALSRVGERASRALFLAILAIGISVAFHPGNTITEYSKTSPYKQESPFLAQAISARTFPAFLDDGDMEAYNHYYREHVARDLILDRSVRPDQPVSEFLLAGNMFFQESLDQLKGQMGEPARRTEAAVPLYAWDIARTPARVIETLPARFRQTARPGDFLAHVHSLDRMAFYSYFGDGVSPTRIGVPGSLAFTFENRAQGFPKYIAMILDYDNLGETDTLLLRTRFDDEPETLLFGSVGRSLIGRAFAVATRDKPFKRLLVTVEIVIRPVTPKYPNWNHGLTRFKGLDIGFYDTNEPVNVYPASFNRHRQDATLTADLGRLAPLEAELLEERGVRRVTDPETGDEVFVAAKDEPGVIVLSLAHAPTDIVLFPRVSGDSRVEVFETTGSNETPLFQINGVPSAWSPVHEGYHFLLPQASGAKGKRTFKVLLDGSGAQLWQRQGALFHAVRR